MGGAQGKREGNQILSSVALPVLKYSQCTAGVQRVLYVGLHIATTPVSGELIPDEATVQLAMDVASSSQEAARTVTTETHWLPVIGLSGPILDLAF